MTIKALKKSMVTLSCDPTLRGQRSKCVIFSKFSKCFPSYRLLSMVMWLMHINQLDTFYKSYGSKNSYGVIWGHRSQKVISPKKLLTPTNYMAWSCDSCICISYIPSIKVMVLKIHLVSQGSKDHFHKKCYNSSMLQSKTIRFKHVHKLETLYLCYGVKGQLGVIRGHSGQILVFTKNTFNLLYDT